PAEIFQRLTKLLTKRLPRTASGPYDGLTGLNVLVGRSAEEAAELFFERVLERRLFLAPATEFHKAHELFCRLCQRGMHASWTRCELVRSNSEVVPIGVPPDDFNRVATGLKSLPRDISESNPAKSKQAATGRLFLQAPGAAQEVAEEMSVWHAVQ